MNKGATKWVKWTKSYNLLAYKFDNFRIFISEHEDGAFYATCLYFERGRVLKAPGQSGSLDFKLETAMGDSFEDAYKKIVTWAMKAFGPEIKINEVA